MSVTEAGTLLPPTMRAWVRQHRGHWTSSLKFVDSHPSPTIPGPDSSDVIVRVTYTVLEYSIIHILPTLPVFPFTPPLIPEICVSGTVVVAGGKAPAELRKPGTKVLATTDPARMIFQGTGALAEFMRVKGDCAVPLFGAGEEDHESISMAEGAALISNGATALTMLKSAKIREGQRVLVNGASGSVGHITTQLCHARGAFVVGVASGGNEALVRTCGVDEFVDYKKHDPLPNYLASTYGQQPFDCIMDCVGTQELFTNSPNYLKEDGCFVNIGAMDVRNGLFKTLGQCIVNLYRPSWLGGVPRRYIFFSNIPKMEEVLTLAEMVKQGKLKILVDSEYAAEDLMQAYKRMATGRARGKILVRMQPEASSSSSSGTGSIR